MEGGRQAGRYPRRDTVTTAVGQRADAVTRPDAANDAPDHAGDPPLPDGLTPRESEVLRLIAAGRSNREIAGALFITEATVKTHINNLFAKAGLRDRAQAVGYAFRHRPAPEGDAP